MPDKTKQGFLTGAFPFFPVARAGILDSVHPGAITAFLIFAALLYWIYRTRRPVARWARGFIAGLVLVTIGAVSGVLDQVFLSRTLDWFWTVSYGLLTFLSFVTGFLFLWDWWKQRKNPGTAARIPLVSDPGFFLVSSGAADNVVPAKKRFLRKIFAWHDMVPAFICGMLAAVISAVWPPEKGIIVMYWAMSFPGTATTVGLMLLLYGAVFSVPFFLLAWGMRRAQKDSGLAGKAREYASKIRVVLAALFLGYGICFLFFYFG